MSRRTTWGRGDDSRCGFHEGHEDASGLAMRRGTAQNSLRVLEAALRATVGELVVQSVGEDVARVAAGELAEDKSFLLRIADGDVGVEDAVHV